MLPSETMIWQPEFTDKTLSRKPGAVHKSKELTDSFNIIIHQ
ncbi:transposase [Escherichia coli]|nr:transposase [Escherichia coli]